jgi:hypothetical protein
MFAACSDSPTKSTPPPAGEGTLLLSRLSVAVVPGGGQDVIVQSTGPNGQPETCEAVCDNGSVAMVTLTDSVLHVQAGSFGKAVIHVTAPSGASADLPIEVYNPRVIDVGELLITYTDQFNLIVTSTYATNSNYYFTIAEPIEIDGFHRLGSFGRYQPDSPTNTSAVMLVKAEEVSDALAFPTGYTWVTEIGVEYMVGIEEKWDVWRPIAPDGYVAMGMVVLPRERYYVKVPPPLDYVVCVREDLTIPAETSWLMNAYLFMQSGGARVGWSVNQPAAEAHTSAYLAPGTFVINPTQPYHDALVNVLKVDLPQLGEAPYQTFVPKLNSYEEPPEETVPTLSRAVMVPCTIVTDSHFVNNLHGRIAESPFYRLERQVFYKRLYHNHNQTSEVQNNLVTITSGITTTESERRWNETGITVSAEAGISISFFSAKITTTLSTTFGYERLTSIEELTQTEIQSSINTPPGKAAALWQKYNRFVLFRHSGAELEPVAAWEFGINSYVTDEYPD